MHYGFLTKTVMVVVPPPDSQTVRVCSLQSDEHISGTGISIVPSRTSTPSTYSRVISPPAVASQLTSEISTRLDTQIFESQQLGTVIVPSNVMSQPSILNATLESNASPSTTLIVPSALRPSGQAFVIVIVLLGTVITPSRVISHQSILSSTFEPSASPSSTPIVPSAFIPL